MTPAPAEVSPKPVLAGDGPTAHAQLPALMEKWLGDILDGMPAPEVRATCNSCAMRSPDHPRTSTQLFTESKCCTYLPTVPNYLVGMILRDPDVDALAQSAFAERLEQLVGVTPMGVGRLPLYGLTYDANRDRVFGRAESLRCPYYVPESGGCGIWRHRNSTCASWFCKHSRGAVGHRFWVDANALFTTIERELSIWVCVQLSLDAEALRQVVMLSTMSDAESLALHLTGAWGALSQSLWGSWGDRHREFFGKAAQLVEPLSWNDIRDVCSPEVGARALVLQNSFRRATSRAWPERVEIGSPAVFSSGAVVTTYSPNDGIPVNDEVLAALSLATNGCATADLVASGVGSPTIQTLLDWEAIRPVRTSVSQIHETTSGSSATSV